MKSDIWPLQPHKLGKGIFSEQEYYVRMWEDLLNEQEKPKSPQPELIEVNYIDLESGQEKKQLMNREKVKESGFDWLDDREDIDCCIVFE